MGRLGRMKAVLLLGVVLLPSLALAAGKCERLVATGSPDAPPYLWRDPQDPRHLIGASADLLVQAASELGLKVEVLYAGTSGQALDEVRSGRVDLVAGMPLSVGELDALDFIHPALTHNDYLVWTRHGSTLVYDSLADLGGHPGAVSQKARLTPSFEALAKEHLNLAPVENLTQAFQKLLLGQVEYVLAGRYTGAAMAQTLGMSNDLVAHGLPLDRPGLYLALSHNSACNDPWLRGQLAKKMTELPASGLTEAVLQRNVERWKAQLQQPLGAPKQ
ncbi:transporter substrate-binding domain-containing protein [Pseudomonas sp. LS1212]|uniref:substrate-binding periplasmic protein n=1 Tax=Pseudomonas sp. LS1212 TaxID=2972478 RepID=UPI00215BE1E7|nr:transporter substrate-binding domain-containing protein [Pseudomonas sp. LS1212]UVJ42489.1 transporter substrate-binding domain-containing protein [Pseudomonas sp. LS1212]